MNSPNSHILLAMLPPEVRHVENALRGLAINSIGVKDLAGVRNALAGQTRPSVVLTQISLGDGNWRDVIGEVSRVDETIPVILYTRAPATELWMDALDSGIYDVIQAECGPAEFLGVIARAIEDRGKPNKSDV
jgi:DNA-binding NtrC family response regulator